MTFKSRREYIFIADGTSLWTSGAKLLAERTGYLPVLWLGHPSGVSAAKELFPKCRFLDERNLNFGVLPIKNRSALPQSIANSPNFIAFYNAALYSMQRNEIFRQIGYLEKREFLNALANFLWSEVEGLEVEGCVASQAPHTAAGLLTAGLMAAKGVELLHFTQVSIAPFVMPRLGFPYKDCEVRGCLESEYSPPDAAPEVWIDEFLNRVEEKRNLESEEFLADIHRGATGVVGIARRLKYLRREVMTLRKEFVGSGVHPLPSGGRMSHALALLRADRYRTRRLRVARASLAKWSRRPSAGQCSFLFLLHFEPEKTTMPDSGLNSDQLSAVRVAASLVPEGTTLWVKEHPSQLLLSTNGHVGRTPGFYEKLASIPNVLLAEPSTSTWEMLDSARIVFTMTGTVGIEAAYLGKLVIYFGQPWYSGLPGTRHISEIDSPLEGAGALLNVASSTQVRDGLSAIIRSGSFGGAVSPGDVRFFGQKGWDERHDAEGLTGVMESYFRNELALRKGRKEIDDARLRG